MRNIFRLKINKDIFQKPFEVLVSVPNVNQIKSQILSVQRDDYSMIVTYP
jgi:hypothetical protein